MMEGPGGSAGYKTWTYIHCVLVNGCGSCVSMEWEEKYSSTNRESWRQKKKSLMQAEEDEPRTTTNGNLQAQCSPLCYGFAPFLGASKAAERAMV